MHFCGTSVNRVNYLKSHNLFTRCWLHLSAVITAAITFIIQRCRSLCLFLADRKSLRDYTSAVLNENASVIQPSFNIPKQNIQRWRRLLICERLQYDCNLCPIYSVKSCFSVSCFIDPHLSRWWNGWVGWGWCSPAPWPEDGQEEKAPHGHPCLTRVPSWDATIKLPLVALHHRDPHALPVSPQVNLRSGRVLFKHRMCSGSWSILYLVSRYCYLLNYFCLLGLSFNTLGDVFFAVNAVLGITVDRLLSWRHLENELYHEQTLNYKILYVSVKRKEVWQTLVWHCLDISDCVYDIVMLWCTTRSYWPQQNQTSC